MEFEKVIRDRMSVRKFSDRKVEPEKLQKILEAGQVAPTGKNSQAFHIYVLESEAALQKADTITRCRYNAPAVLLVTGRPQGAFVSDKGHSFYEIDASIVTTHMMLEAANLSVDSVWIGLFDPEDTAKVFDLPEDEVPVALLDLGYRTDDCPDNPRHTQYRPLDELVTRL